MKDNEKRIVIILLIAIVVVIGILVFAKINGGKTKTINTNTVETGKTEEFVEFVNEGTKLNNSNKLKETKKFEGIEIKDLQLTYANNKTELIAKVKNTTSSATTDKTFYVVFLDKNGKELGKIGGYINPLKPEEEAQFSSTAMRDYSNAYDFKIEKSK